MHWSDDLINGTPAHKIAASQNRRIRVVAGPGTGKSFAMKCRVARLLEEGVDPEKILSVTFTRVAAEDLHRELRGMGTPKCDRLKCTTLHSIALRVLMRNHVLKATGRIPRPLNNFEMEPLIADLKEAHGGKKAVKKLRKAYEAAWARFQYEVPRDATPQDAAFEADLINWLRFHCAMLIGEVIPQFYEYLHLNPAAKERTEFSHILVDEFQDLNKAEQGVIGFLSNNSALCIFGDDDQSIYRFRHAHPEGIEDWLDKNLNADDIGLDECRRCPTQVVELANSLIAHNRLRPKPRRLLPIPANGKGEVQIVQFKNLGDEITGVTNIVSRLVADGTPTGDILILAQRATIIGTPIYEALVEKQIPAKSYYAEAELSSTDAQRRFSLLKLFVNKQDKVALRWLLGVDDNGHKWHAAGYRPIRDHCELVGISPWDALVQLAEKELALPYTNKIVNVFNNLIKELDAIEALPDLAAVIDALFPADDDTYRGIRELALQVLDEIDDEDRQELLTTLTQVISKPDIPSEIEEVRIMSLHKSKGLSSPITVITGCVEGLLPSQPSNDLPLAEIEQHIEEQRRLFFVGISRVKASPQDNKPGMLFLTYSQEMSSAEAYGSRISPARRECKRAILNASRFIGELGPNAPEPVAG